MKTKSIKKKTDSAVWVYLTELTDKLPTQATRALAQMTITSKLDARMRDLLRKQRLSTISPEEAKEMDQYEQLTAMLDIIRAQAHMALQKEAVR